MVHLETSPSPFWFVTFWDSRRGEGEEEEGTGPGVTEAAAAGRANELIHNGRGSQTEIDGGGLSLLRVETTDNCGGPRHTHTHTEQTSGTHRQI